VFTGPSSIGRYAFPICMDMEFLPGPRDEGSIASIEATCRRPRAGDRAMLVSEHHRRPEVGGHE
jgi:hypothetical protein